MCADDVACSGAEPLFFLDYVAVGGLDPDQIAELVTGIAAGCRDAGCALVGGETAEHPGLMQPGEFDLAGFCVGVVEADERIDGSAVQAGDVIVGLPVERAPQQRLLARAVADRELGSRPRAALPGAAPADAGRRRGGHRRRSPRSRSTPWPRSARSC